MGLSEIAIDLAVWLATCSFFLKITVINRDLFLFLLFVSIVIGSCTTSKNPLFSKRSPHEKYGDALKDAGLGESELARAWFSEAQKSLRQPQPIDLPYKETGFFAAEKPAAFAFIFRVKRGQKLNINLITVPQSGFRLFTELWRASGDDFSLIATLDTSSSQLNYTVKKDEELILRIQPELLKTVEYIVTITTGPSLAFPVDSSGKPRIISTWGADRDGGKRSHEGVDIAAAFRTPALAAADGFIGRVTDNNLGGKVVFLVDENTGNSLYYAHLDSQIAKPGERVKVDDVVGLVGKTGNAKNTIPHLHFGIYTVSGAIDPLPFINPKIETPGKIVASLNELNNWAHLLSSASLFDGATTESKSTKLSENEAIFVAAATSDWYKVVLPSGKTGFVKSKNISAKNTDVVKIKSNTRFFDAPDSLAPAKAIILKDTTLENLGTHNDYFLTKYNDLLGWIEK